VPGSSPLSMQLLHAGQAVHESSQHVAPEERESSQSVPVSSPLSTQLLRAGQAAHEHIVHAEPEPPQSVTVSSSLSVRSLHGG
jgi:hypothetical protein